MLAGEADVGAFACVFFFFFSPAAQVGAVRLFFTPEEGHDPPSVAKRHFLQTGEGSVALTGNPGLRLIFSGPASR